jgi:hypothetical protein
MLEGRIESGARLPIIPQDMVPTVEARCVRDWEMMGLDRRREAVSEFSAVFAVDPARATGHPWFRVLANLSVGPFEEELED